MYRYRNDARKFDGSKPSASSCKDENGDLVTDSWRKHFSTLIQGDDYTNTDFRDVVPNPIDNEGVEILPPNHEEVKVAIMRLKNNKAVGLNGLITELIKTRSNELVGPMH